MCVQGESGEVEVLARAARAARADQAADGVPIVTDAPQCAANVLRCAGVRQPIVWDVLELAGLLVPASPRDTLERAAAFFGIVVEGSGLARQAQCILMLFELLLATIDRVDTQTLLHVTRLASGLDWPLWVLFSEIQRGRALSPLETGALASATPIGGWITQGAVGRRRRADNPEAHAPPPRPLEPDELAQ